MKLKLLYALVITIGVLTMTVSQSVQAVTNSYAWPTDYCTDKLLVKLPNFSRDIYAGKLTNGICYGYRVSSVSALQALVQAGYVNIDTVQAQAITAQININKSSLTANSQEYLAFSASPILYTVSRGISATATVQAAQTVVNQVATATTIATTSINNNDKIAVLQGLLAQLTQAISLLGQALGVSTNVSTAVIPTTGITITSANQAFINKAFLLVDRSGEFYVTFRDVNQSNQAQAYKINTLDGLAPFFGSGGTYATLDYDNDGFNNGTEYTAGFSAYSSLANPIINLSDIVVASQGALSMTVANYCAVLPCSNGVPIVSGTCSNNVCN